MMWLSKSRNMKKKKKEPALLSNLTRPHYIQQCKPKLWILRFSNLLLARGGVGSLRKLTAQCSSGPHASLPLSLVKDGNPFRVQLSHNHINYATTS
ncbi:hypothetical protein CEXT_795351 [Caerostris extrusa]|uniref:Uncharacterized protein n=1 Tax=Caerostris extrusa TaxID=172846 RepID=A0AAV4XUP0_CAEEX|nr:hypothetical protein CEXT_795351 [Caerostris extrusa]